MTHVFDASRHDPDHAPAALRAAGFWAVLAIAAVVAFGGYLNFVDDRPLGIDSWWHDLVTVSRGSMGYAIAVFMANIGTGLGAGVCGAVVAALFLVLRYPRGSATVATAMLFGVAASSLLKTLIARPRPWDQLYSVHGSSYPSGHTMGAAALAVSVALSVIAAGWVTRRQARWVWAAAVAWTALMAWSRTALHVHWLSDTVAGALLGTAAALIAAALWKPGSWQSDRTGRQPAVGGAP